MAATGTLVSTAGETAAGASAGTPAPANRLASNANGIVGQLGTDLTNTGNSLQDNGVGGIPAVGGTAAKTASVADSTLDPLAKVTVTNSSVVGSSSPNGQLIGASVLSKSQAPGSVLQTSALSNNQAATAAVDGRSAVGKNGVVGPVPLATPKVGNLNTGAATGLVPATTSTLTGLTGAR